MRSIRLPRWPILILLAAFFIGPTAEPARAAPLPVPAAASQTAPGAALEQVQYYYGHRRHWGHRHYGFRRHYGYRRHFGYRRGWGHHRGWGHRRPAFYY